MGRPIIDLSGQKHNGITILSVYSKETGKATRWKCLCHCGNTFVCIGNYVVSGKTKSCGCKRYHYSFINDRKTYASYTSMLGRCLDPNNKNYPSYGGSGITVCKDWALGGKEGYLNFVRDMGIRPPKTSINRINGSKIYSKTTCEWASYSLQSFDQKQRKDSPGPISGVVYRKDRNKWTAAINVNGELISLYYGDSEDEAIEARRRAEIKFFGRFKN